VAIGGNRASRVRLEFHVVTQHRPHTATRGERSSAYLDLGDRPPARPRLRRPRL